MEVTVQEILDQVNDYVRNYTTGTADLGARLRAVNRATEYIKRRMTLPSDETTSSFYFSRDQLYYPAPLDMNEPIDLLYSDANYNAPATQWNYVPYPDLLRLTGTSRQNYWSTGTFNGLAQIIMLGYNLFSGQQLQTFTSLSGFSGQNDATTLAIDNNIYSVPPASLSFTIDPTLGFGKGSIYFPVFWDIQPFISNNGTIKIDAYLPSTNLTAIDLVMGSDASNYYTFSCDTTDSGASFTADQFNRLHWSYLDGPAIVGSPNNQNITFVRIDFIQNGSFGSVAIPGFRIDNMYEVFPDQMTFIYNTMYKGTDSTGVTQKVMFTANTDIAAFGKYAPDLLDPIALRAAYLLEPRLRGDKDFMNMYREECEAVLKVFGRIYPRKRIINLGQTILQRPRYNGRQF